MPYFYGNKEDYAAETQRAADEYAAKYPGGAPWQGKNYSQEELRQQEVDRRNRIWKENEPYAVDPNDFQMAGQKGFADYRTKMLTDYARDAQARQGVQVDRALVNSSRGQQMGAIAAQQEAAAGNAPSAANAAYQQGSDQAIQAAAAANPKMRRSAQMSFGRGVGQIGSQAATQRAEETARANASALGGAGNLYGQDTGLAYGQAQLEAKQRAMNDQRALQLYGLGNQTLGQQLQAGVRGEEVRVGGTNAADAIRAKADLATEERQSADRQKVLGAGLSMGSAFIGSDVRMKRNLKYGGT